MRIHKKKWNKKLNKRELKQAFYAIAKGNPKLWFNETVLAGRGYGGGAAVL